VKQVVTAGVSGPYSSGIVVALTPCLQNSKVVLATAQGSADFGGINTPANNEYCNHGASGVVGCSIIKQVNITVTLTLF